MSLVHDTPNGFRHFHDQMDELKARLLAMSTRAEEMIEQAVDALLHNDHGIAEMVVASDSEINAFEVEIEQ